MSLGARELTSPITGIAGWLLRARRERPCRRRGEQRDELAPFYA